MKHQLTTVTSIKKLKPQLAIIISVKKMKLHLTIKAFTKILKKIYIFLWYNSYVAPNKSIWT